MYAIWLRMNNKLKVLRPAVGLRRMHMSFKFYVVRALRPASLISESLATRFYRCNGTSSVTLLTIMYPSRSGTIEDFIAESRNPLALCLCPLFLQTLSDQLPGRRV